MGPLRNSDGSAEWSAGQAPHTLRIVCSVNGPLESKIRDELPQHATLEVVYRRNIGLPMIRERFIQDKLHTCLLAMLRRDLMPRSLVQVVVQLLEGGGTVEAEVAEGINVMSCALVDAGVPMSGLVCAASYGISESGEIVLLVNQRSTKELKSLHAVAYKFADGDLPKLVLCESIGEFTEEQLYEVLRMSGTDCAGIVEKIKA